MHKIVAEPVPNLMSLAGTLKNNALKGKNIAGIVKQEKEAVIKVICRKHPLLKK